MPTKSVLREPRAFKPSATCITAHDGPGPSVMFLHSGPNDFSLSISKGSGEPGAAYMHVSLILDREAAEKLREVLEQALWGRVVIEGTFTAEEETPLRALYAGLDAGA